MIEEKDKTIDELQKKLGECAETLKGNAKMIDDLNKNLAEA